MIVGIAFGFGDLRRFMLSFLMFYFVSFVSGGGMLAAHFLLQSNHELIEGMVATQSTGYGDKVSWLFVLIGFPVMMWFSKSRWNQVETTKLKANVLAKVEITIMAQKFVCRGLIDTGNQLYEPITRVPVMMVESTSLRGFIPEAIIKQQESVKKNMNLDLDEADLPEEWLQRIRLIPYRGVQQGMEFMIALKPDQVEIEYEQENFKTTRVLLGLNLHALSSDGMYQAIIHPALVQKSEKEEAI